MQKINTIWTPAIGTNNLMDVWIYEMVEQELQNLFPQHFFYSIPTKDYLKRFGNHTKKSQFVFVAGTNLISSSMHFPYTKQWKLRLTDILSIRELILVGVGWRTYERQPDIYTRFLLKNLLSKRFFHSVRDNYTKAKLHSIGIHNVINTGCPTMWSLNKEWVKDIPTTKAQNVVITLCKGKHTNEHIDKKILGIIKEHYGKIFFWPQSDTDMDYLGGLISDFDWKHRITIVNPHLNAYKNFLKSDLPLDSIGLRLHAGILALNYKRRAIIIGIDNRATEISKDTDLNVIPYTQVLNRLEKAIHSRSPSTIKMPFENIERWRAQFSSTM